ncbi:hypothetical protein M9Y10_001399 [Tritrichomonas musculus]|uniref:Uncharacterized protein n=1 Tax=Tritrichomonas musculus TaxID=1915356 RepID=A0ABR2L6Z6_9EUKA
MFSLNIFMQTLELSPSIIEENDTIRVSVTTLPGEQKQAFTVEAKKMKASHPFFSVKINDQTEKLLVVIRKKSFSQKDPIIASTVIKGDQLPKKFNDNTNTELKTIKLLEPLQQNGKKTKGSSRKQVGQIEIQFSLTQEFTFSKNTMKAQKNKKRNGQGYSKIDTLLDNENEYGNFLFNDPITN